MENAETPETQPLAQADREAAPVDTEQPPRLPFPVVGIGASAGGLQAVTEFLSSVQPGSGMAFVFVQHLPPTGDSMLVDILSKRSRIPVHHIEDVTPVEQDKFYVIRPGQTLTLKDGQFHLGKRLERPMGNRPVDDFFKSLASDQRERGIAIILSGMGSNGSAGAQAIKAVGGLCIAQDPESCEYPSMPRHLIDAGYADYILRPKDMFDVISEYAGHPYASGQREEAASPAKRDLQYIQEILAILRTRTHQDFSGYKKPTILRRIQRRMGLNRVTKLGEYAKMLRQTPAEVTNLADDLLIHVTGFFRDAPAWDVLRAKVVVPLIATRSNDEEVRCWVTACSTGEEAYSLAILLMEECERVGKRLDIKVFATDMADRTLTNARAGVYPGGIEAEITPDRLDRFFLKEDAVYRVRPELRERVVFAPQNVLQDPPFSRLDIVSCRNLLIYLEPDMQSRILGLLHFGLRDGGTLFLGTSETAGGDGLFEPIDKTTRIFRRIGPTRHGATDFPLPRTLRNSVKDLSFPPPRGSVARPSMTQIINRSLLEYHTPAAVTIDQDARIIFYHGNTEPFIGLPKGEPTRDLLELARESIRGAVRTAIQRAKTTNGPVTVMDGIMEIVPGRRVRMAVMASPLDSKYTPGHLIISFQDRGEATEKEPQKLNTGDSEELRRVREELQSTIEELQTSNEESKASHEEIVSTNEELQSTNEELETSREEMQSLNEELNTVNSQLRVKIDEHQAASNDLASLLSSTDIAVLFLDTKLCIRRFTAALRRLMELIPSDVGRPLNDMARKFDDPALVTDAHQVLESLIPIEREISAENDRWYLRRALPYRTTDSRIVGVVVTFVDITDRRRAEVALRESEERQKFMLKLSDALRPLADPLEIQKAAVQLLGEKLNVDRAYFVEIDEVRKTARVTWNYLRGDSPSLVGEHRVANFGSIIPVLRRGETVLIEDVMRSPLVNESDRPMMAGIQIAAHINAPLIKRGVLVGALCVTEVQPRLWRQGEADLVTETGERIWAAVERARTEVALRERQEQLQLVIEGARGFAIIMMDVQGRITSWNIGAERLLGYSEKEAINQSITLIFTPEDIAGGGADAELDGARNTGQASDERWHVRKNGERFWGSGVLSALYDPANGALRGFAKVMRDETARKLAESELQSAKQSAEHANQIKDEFLATLSHELRTPLSTVLIWSKLLQSRKDLSGEFVEALDAIVRSAESQKQLIDDLLDTSRITAGKLRMEMQDVKLPAVVRSAIETVSPTAEAKGVAISTHFGEDVGFVYADPDRLRQVIWNLLSNAIKFTPMGGAIDVGLWRHGNEVEIRVSDTGKGLISNLLPHVFELFWQADAGSTRAHGGLGLGLAICKKLVEQHGGTITAASNGIDKGATFTIRLPLPAVKAQLPTRSTNGKTKASSKSPITDTRIWLVDDDADTRRALEKLLTDAGAIVSAFESVTAAFEGINGSKADVIISDIGMPGQDGYSLIKQLRARGSEDKDTPAIALTAFARPEDRDRAITAGFNFHLGKPVDPNRLLLTIQQAIKRKSMT